MNFIMVSVFQSPLVDQDNGLTKTDHAMMLMPNVTLLTHQLEHVPLVFKDITTLTVFVVLRDNSTLTETVSLLPLLHLFPTATVAETLPTVLDVLDATVDSKDSKINTDFIIAKLYD